jgi:methylmalonyl-CoA mutase, N-terminal domain
VGRLLEALRDGARGTQNLLVPIREALRGGCTLGEVCGALRDVFGSHRGG